MTQVSDGTVGAKAGKVTLTGSDRYAIIRPEAGALQRRRRPLHPQRLPPQRQPGQGRLPPHPRMGRQHRHQQQQVCPTATSSWTAFPSVSYLAAGGTQLDVVVVQYNATAGDSFEVDGLSLPGRARDDDRLGSERDGHRQLRELRLLLQRTRLDLRMLARRRRLRRLQLTQELQRPQRRQPRVQGAGDRRSRERGSNAGRTRLDDRAGGQPAFERLLRDRHVRLAALERRVTQASDGTVGSKAAKVTLTSSDRYAIISNPKPVASTWARRCTRLNGFLRSDTPGKQVCLRIREWTGGVNTNISRSARPRPAAGPRSRRSATSPPAAPSSTSSSCSTTPPQATASKSTDSRSRGRLLDLSSRSGGTATRTTSTQRRPRPTAKRHGRRLEVGCGRDAGRDGRAGLDRRLRQHEVQLGGLRLPGPADRAIGDRRSQGPRLLRLRRARPVRVPQRGQRPQGAERNDQVDRPEQDHVHRRRLELRPADARPDSALEGRRGLHRLRPVSVSHRRRLRLLVDRPGRRRRRRFRKPVLADRAGVRFRELEMADPGGGEPHAPARGRHRIWPESASSAGSGTTTRSSTTRTSAR